MIRPAIKLTDEQANFLTSHRINLNELFDASGMRRIDYEREMEKTGQHFALGVTPCKRAGHSIRTKYGHCVQCKPDKISYMLRHTQPGCVYIAGSLSRQLIKIGSSTRLDQRLYNLNLERYGGAYDWAILAVAESGEAGRVEVQAQEKLRQFRHASTSVRSGEKIRCYELFRCSFSEASAALIAALSCKSELRVIADTSSYS